MVLILAAAWYDRRAFKFPFIRLISAVVLWLFVVDLLWIQILSSDWIYVLQLDTRAEKAKLEEKARW